MAEATYSGASFDDGNVSVNLEYNTANLNLNTVVVQNLTSQNAQVTFTDPQSVAHTFAIPAGTASTPTNVTSLGLNMVKVVQINPKTGQQETFINLPAGWSISCNWPI